MHDVHSKQCVNDHLPHSPTRLRAEPGNCQPTMLPLAMRTLFFNARQGLGLRQEEHRIDPENSREERKKVHWRTCVHALNIVRLLVLDAALGPDMDAYIPEATTLAVTGFRSPRW